jgi:hypothetical protein
VECLAQWDSFVMVGCVAGTKNVPHLLTAGILSSALQTVFAVKLNAWMIHSVILQNHIVCSEHAVQRQNVCQKIINVSHMEKTSAVLKVSVMVLQPAPQMRDATKMNTVTLWQNCAYQNINAMESVQWIWNIKWMEVTAVLKNVLPQMLIVQILNVQRTENV